MCCCVSSCAGNPCSVPCSSGSPASTPANPGASLYCTVMADTVGVVVRAFSARPTWLGGSGMATIDSWTKKILLACEKGSLTQAGACPTCAAAQAAIDVNGSLKSNCADPCSPAKAPMSLETVIILVVAGAIVLIVATNVFAHKLAD